jgi:predicted alpha/beta superfamily hydrolase
MYRKEVRVIYPLKTGSIVLRTEHDWTRNLDADSVSDDGQICSFTVSSERPFLYCKPCLLDENGFKWAHGTNNLVVLTESGSRDIYPFFFSKFRSEITPLIEIESSMLSRLHLLRVCLPPGYNENTLKCYPVVYMHDGKNLFFPDEAFKGQDWNVEETLELLEAMNVIDKLIVVGLYAQNREEEYTKPGYEPYGRSLVGEVKPLIDERFRTLKGPEQTGVMGSSLGGVVSFYLAWQWPDVFGQAACMSSTFSWRDDLIERVLQEPKRNIKVYLDSGWPNDNYEVTLSMCMAMIERGFVAGRDFLHFVFPMAEHDEASWGARCHLPLQLFNGEVTKASQTRTSK